MSEFIHTSQTHTNTHTHWQAYLLYTHTTKNKCHVNTMINVWYYLWITKCFILVTYFILVAIRYIRLVIRLVPYWWTAHISYLFYTTYLKLRYLFQVICPFHINYWFKTSKLFYITNSHLFRVIYYSILVTAFTLVIYSGSANHFIILQVINGLFRLS